jgi:DNA primase
MPSPVEQIKERLDISDIISSYIKIEKAGSNFKAKCPFHNEKTPSFFISPSRGTYYCFGCGAKGDMFSFVQEFEGVSFPEALKMLAEKAGVKLTDGRNVHNSENAGLLRITEEATEFFEGNLKKSPEARKYLTGRGLKEETINDFRLGFVSNEWRTLFNFFKAKGVKEDKLLSAGLIKKTSEEGKRETYYDVFRGRIMFPIGDSSGRIIGFSGRILVPTDKAPKYVNSPETAIFKKSEVLYGLDKAKQEIRKKDYSILVEGQMDLIMAHQEGFANTVASSGTAFTEGHLLRLKRLSSRIIMAFDSDSAGFQAAKKSAELSLSLGMEVKIAALPKGTDPAELMKDNLTAWRESLRGSKHIIDFYLDSLLSRGTEGRNLAKEVKVNVLPFVQLLPSSIDKSHFVSQIAKKSGLREDAIWQDLKVTLTPNLSQEILNEEDFNRGESTHKDYIIRRIFGILLWQKHAEIKNVDIEKLEKGMKGILEKEEFSNLYKQYEKIQEELVFEVENYYGEGTFLDKDLHELLIHFEEDVLRNKFIAAMRKLQEAEEKKDEKKTVDLLLVCQAISERLSDLSRKSKIEVQKP